MAYGSGNTIDSADYNTFAGQVNAIIADKYGQTPIATVASGTVISAAQWATLLNSITTASNHQGSTITAITNPSSTDTIAFETNLTSNISVIETAGNSGDCAASGIPITAGGSVDRTTSWNVAVTMPMTVTFAGATEMANFFNAGGILNLTFSRTGGSVESKNDGWSALCTACGTVAITGAAASKTIAGTAYTGTTKIGGSGSPSILLTGTGANDYTGIPTTIFQQYDVSANYTSNNIKVDASVSGAVITLSVTFTDDANANTDELVDGTLNTTLTAVPADTTYISNTWGTPTLGGSESGS